MSKYELLDTGEKSRVIGFRVSESVYSALEKLAEAQGGTVSASARNLLLKNLEVEEMRTGDALLDKTTGLLVLLMDKETTSISDINTEVMKISAEKVWKPESILMKPDKPDRK